jgi:hypothetical protein
MEIKKCSVENCINPTHVRGWCKKHYTTWQRHGDPNYKRTFKKDLKCIVEGCERTQKSGGYCHKHYKKMRETGTLKILVHGPEWKAKMSESRKTELTKLDSTPDTKNRGYLAVNVVNDLKYKARQRGIEWTLTPIEAYKLIIADCLYCGEPSGWPITRNGIDRVDNHKGYHNDNCVTCCSSCNSAKGDKTLEEFILWIKKLYIRLVDKGV